MLYRKNIKVLKLYLKESSMTSWEELHRLCEFTPESKDKIHKWVIKKAEE